MITKCSLKERKPQCKLAAPKILFYLSNLQGMDRKSLLHSATVSHARIQKELIDTKLLLSASNDDDITILHRMRDAKHGHTPLAGTLKIEEIE